MHRSRKHIIALQKHVKYPTVKKSAISIPEGASISWNIFEKPRISGITVGVMLQRRSYICRNIRFRKPWGIHFITISTQRFPKTTQTKKSIHDMVFYLTWQLCCFNFKGCNSHFIAERNMGIRTVIEIFLKKSIHKAIAT